MPPGRTRREIEQSHPGSSIYFPNQWRKLRHEHGLSQREVAQYLGHLNVDYYQDVEAGRRFPRSRILSLLLVLYGANFSDAYPFLMEEAVTVIQTIKELRPHL